ncbi:hypothetical protein CCH79_00013198 [Gambusia affinis]|uniref:ZP-C domain-containing protein n=1 Tax=Gambusia affinis TaxID=33528 RepID=A0A315W9X3_GAMAF|nr:hypothetical protein CCH79_00013198 [Gambusia affinis]
MSESFSHPDLRERRSVLLLSRGNLCSAAQNSLRVSLVTNETLRKQVTTSSQQATRLSPVTLRLRNLSRSGEEQSLQVAEARLSSEQKETDPAAGCPELNMSSPDPSRKRPKVVRPERPAPAVAVLARCGEEKVTVASAATPRGLCGRPSPLTSKTEQQLCFALRFVTKDWRSLRASNVYSMREMMHMEAAVMQGVHVPLRVFVDSCVVTASPDPTSHPSYSIIVVNQRVKSHRLRCLMDSKLTGAQSYFMPRSQEDKLHFQMKAFKFTQDDRSELIPTTVTNRANNPRLFLLMLPPSASYPSMGLLCGAGVALAVVMGSVSTLVCSRLHKPAGYSVCT